MDVGDRRPHVSSSSVPAGISSTRPRPAARPGAAQPQQARRARRRELGGGAQHHARGAAHAAGAIDGGAPVGAHDHDADERDDAGGRRAGAQSGEPARLQPPARERPERAVSGAAVELGAQQRDDQRERRQQPVQRWRQHPQRGAGQRQTVSSEQDRVDGGRVEQRAHRQPSAQWQPPAVEAIEPPLEAEDRPVAADHELVASVHREALRRSGSCARST